MRFRFWPVFARHYMLAVSLWPPSYGQLSGPVIRDPVTAVTRKYILAMTW